MALFHANPILRQRVCECVWWLSTMAITNYANKWALKKIKGRRKRRRRRKQTQNCLGPDTGWTSFQRFEISKARLPLAAIAMLCAYLFACVRACVWVWMFFPLLFQMIPAYKELRTIKFKSITEKMKDKMGEKRVERRKTISQQRQAMSWIWEERKKLINKNSSNSFFALLFLVLVYFADLSLWC